MPGRPFQLAPQPIPDDFKWRSHLYHLTYPTHVEIRYLWAVLLAATAIPLIGYSVVHEDGEDENGEPYHHTHWAMIFKTRLQLQGCRKFDVQLPDPADGSLVVLHPHILPKTTMVQMEQLFLQYHAGRKYNIQTGKTEFKPPVWREFKLPPNFEWTDAILREVIEAPTLRDACLAGGVRPRSVSDLKALRAENDGAPKKFRHKYDSSTFKPLVTPGWHVLHVWGTTGLGKTKWACSRFENPLVVKPFNSIGCLEILCKRFDPKVHDGIVCDECDLRFMSREQAIAFCDPDEEAVFDHRFAACDKLPADARKILVSNGAPEQLYPTGLGGMAAILRRIVRYQITGPTWWDAPQATVQASPLVATPQTQVTVPATDTPAPVAQPLPSPAAMLFPAVPPPVPGV